jgi:hypothetical protein
MTTEEVESEEADMSDSSDLYATELVTLNPKKKEGGFALCLGEVAELAGFEEGDNIEVMVDPQSGNPPSLMLLKSPVETDQTRRYKVWDESHAEIRVPKKIRKQYLDEPAPDADPSNPLMFNPEVDTEAEVEGIYLHYFGHVWEVARSLRPDQEVPEEEKDIVDKSVEFAAQLTGDSPAGIYSGIRMAADVVLEADGLDTVAEYPPVDLEELGGKVMFVPTETFVELMTDAGVSSNLTESVEITLTNAVDETLEEHGKTEYRGFDQVSVPVLISYKD